MTLLPVIFEDQTLTGFRPATWSVPVGELRCGLLNARERVAILTGREPALLCRSFLNELATAGGLAAGVDAVRALRAADTRLLLINGRVGGAWNVLSQAVEAARAGEDLAWGDDEGLLVLSTDADASDGLLDSWAAWERSADAAGCWRDGAGGAPAWRPAAEPVRRVDGAWSRIWDLVPATAAVLAADVARIGRTIPARTIWGAVPDDPATASWCAAVDLSEWRDAAIEGVIARGRQNILIGPDCDLAPGVAIDATAGPVVLGRGVRVMPHSYLEGPLSIGSGSLVKAGSAIYGETSLGAVNKVAGEIGESTFLDFVNKQHEGFIGHAYLASWCNLGAMTTCSDLKNTYGTIRVDLGGGPQDSGRRFVGLMMGEHGKTAIGTLFNTGTTVGFAGNVFAAGFPGKCLPCFTWGDGDGAERQDPMRARNVAATVLARRGCRATTGHDEVFSYLGG